MTTPDQPDQPGRDPLDALYIAVRRHFPQITVACVNTGEWLRGQEEPDRYVRVAYRQATPCLIVADGSAYVWRSGPDEGALIGNFDRVEQAAKAIAGTLGIRPTP